MGQPATAGIIVACIFIGMAVAYFGYRGYVKWHRHRNAPLDAELPPIRQPLGHSMYASGGVSGSFAASPGGTPEYSPWRGMAGSMSKSSFAMDRPGSIYGGGLSTLGGDTNSGGGGYHSRSHSLAGLSPPAATTEHDSRPTSPYSASTSYPIDSTSLAELGVAVPPRVASPDAISEAGASNAPPSSSHRQRTMSSSSSTMTLRRSYAGDYYSSSRRNSALFGSSGNIGGGGIAGGGAGPSSKRDSYLPHLPSNRDAIQIVPPQPLGIGLGGLATAMDQKTLAFSKSSGIGLGEEAFGDSKFSWTDSAGQQQQQDQQAQAQTQHQHQRSLSPSSGSVSGSGSIGPQQLHRYLQEGPLGRNSEAARRSPWEATSGSGGYAGVPPVRGGTPQSSHYNGTTANSSPILGAQQHQQQGAFQHNSKPLPFQPHSSSDTAAGSSSSRSASGTAGSPSASGSGSGSGGSRSNDDDVNSPHHTHNDSLSSSMTTTTKTSHHDHHGSPVPGDAPAHKLGGADGEEKAASFAAPVAPLTTTAAAAVS